MREILWLRDQKITTGYKDGAFKPKNKITREAMAAFLFRAAGESEVSGEADFTDLDSTTFADEITWLAEEKITTGYGDNTFRPKKGDDS